MGNYEMTIDILRLVSNQANKYVVTILGARLRGGGCGLSSHLFFNINAPRVEERIV